jgi:hypothetical protein
MKDKFLEGYKAGFENGVLYGSLYTSMMFTNALLKIAMEKKKK